ncbi:MAG TPA: TPM domain-containing protein [Prolixibacteraceae bacterium]|nr:TPM domain-containing protein [Prolixibacteraceae bacterium]
MKNLVLTVLTTLFGFASFASDLPARPEPPTLVTDFANVFTSAERAQLESRLVDFFAATSTQIAIVTVGDLQGYDKADYAYRLGEAWGIGSEKFNNGILVLLKPKTANSNGEVFIAVGYGLEGVVPDITAKQIVEKEMIPRFKVNDMFGGVDRATQVLIELTKGEYNYQQYAKKAEGGGFSPFLIFLLLFVVVPMLFGRRRSFYAAGNKSSLPFWIAMGLLGSANKNHSGHFNNFSSGSGSFGGGSSFGSFGGFGGGSFGGGGAGGSW